MFSFNEKNTTWKTLLYISFNSIQNAIWLEKKHVCNSSLSRNTVDLQAENLGGGLPQSYWVSVLDTPASWGMLDWAAKLHSTWVWPWECNAGNQRVCLPYMNPKKKLPSDLGAGYPRLFWMKDNRDEAKFRLENGPGWSLVKSTVLSSQKHQMCFSSADHSIIPLGHPEFRRF